MSRGTSAVATCDHCASCKHLHANTATGSTSSSLFTTFGSGCNTNGVKTRTCTGGHLSQFVEPVKSPSVPPPVVHSPDYCDQSVAGGKKASGSQSFCTKDSGLTTTARSTLTGASTTQCDSGMLSTPPVTPAVTSHVVIGCRSRTATGPTVPVAGVAVVVSAPSYAGQCADLRSYLPSDEQHNCTGGLRQSAMGTPGTVLGGTIGIGSGYGQLGSIMPVNLDPTHLLAGEESGPIGSTVASASHSSTTVLGPTIVTKTKDGPGKSSVLGSAPMTVPQAPIAAGGTMSATLSIGTITLHTVVGGLLSTVNHSSVVSSTTTLNVVNCLELDISLDMP